MGVFDRASGPWRPLAVTLTGAAVSLAVAVAVSVIEMITGFNIFGFSIWVIVPAGAFITGIAAASGYYFSSLYLHTKAGWWVAIQMVVIAALTNLLIYYLEYYFFKLDGQSIRDRVGFFQFESIALTHQELRIGRGMARAGETGDFGYWLAVIDFVGFLLGGLTMFLILFGHPTCATCPRYLHTRAVKNRYFTDMAEAGGYYDGLFGKKFNDPVFIQQALLGAEKPPKGNNAGSVLVETKIMECPECSGQTWNDTVKVWGGREWKEVKNTARSVRIPLGTNLVPILRAPKR